MSGVLVERDGGVARVWLDRPERHNALAADLAGALTEAVADRERARHFGLAGRARAVEHFSWGSIGDQTMAVYEQVLGS